MRVKVQDADALWPTELCDRRGVWPGDGVISAEHDRDCTRRRNFTNLPKNLTVAVFNAARHHRRIARINGGKNAEGINADLQRVQEPRLILGLANSAWTEACPRSMRYSVVEWRSDNGDIRLHALDLTRILNPWELREGDWTNV